MDELLLQMGLRIYQRRKNCASPKALSLRPDF